MEDNPTALWLKELETLEKVTEKIDKISVFGGLDGVLKDLVKIRRGQVQLDRPKAIPSAIFLAFLILTFRSGRALADQ